MGLAGLSFVPERTDFGPEMADLGSQMAELRGALGGGGWTYVRTEGQTEIHPCVLQDIGPLRTLLKKT